MLRWMCGKQLCNVFNCNTCCSYQADSQGLWTSCFFCFFLNYPYSTFATTHSKAAIEYWSLECHTNRYELLPLSSLEIRPTSRSSRLFRSPPSPPPPYLLQTAATPLVQCFFKTLMWMTMKNEKQLHCLPRNCPGITAASSSRKLVCIRLSNTL